MPSTPAAGASRKQSCEGAYAKPPASVDASSTAMEVEPHCDSVESQIQVGQPEDPVEDTEPAAAAQYGQQAAQGSDQLARAHVSESKEEEAAQEAQASELVATIEVEAAQAELSDSHCAEFEQAVADSELSAADPDAADSEHPQSAELDPSPEPQVAKAADLMEPDSKPVVLESAADEVLLAAGARPLLQEEDLQAACFSFLSWLASPCMTACEALVKAKRVKSTSQLAPIKNTLKFTFALLYESKVIDSIDLKVLLRLSVAQALYKAIVDRQVGSGRMHQIFLLVKKVLVYFSSCESGKLRQFVQPTAYESYLYVENICSESSNQRKQDQRNRMVLGISGARGALAEPKEMFQIPKIWSGDASPPQAPASPQQLRPQLRDSVVAEDAPTGISPNQIMTKEELSSVTQACVTYLSSTVTREAPAANSHGAAAHADSDLHFMHHLVTATFCLGMAPRSQVLQQLRIGSSLTKEADGLYWIRMKSEESKNHRPTMFALASELTPAYDHYLQCVRPRLLALSTQAAQHDYVFFKRSGAAPRSDFSSSTCLVTQQVLGRPVNAHTFRSSLITTFYSSGATEAEMSTLASIMAHDPSTQRNFYYKPKHNSACVQIGQRMVDQLL